MIWLLPATMLMATVLLAIPLSRYLSWIMNGEYHAPSWLAWFERRLDTGNQNWKQYTIALLVFNTALFIYSYVVLAVQPWMPLNGLHRGRLLLRRYVAGDDIHVPADRFRVVPGLFDFRESW
jgi:potassium-transporting ATPase potassium-binding subunit